MITDFNTRAELTALFNSLTKSSLNQQVLGHFDAKLSGRTLADADKATMVAKVFANAMEAAKP